MPAKAIPVIDKQFWLHKLIPKGSPYPIVRHILQFPTVATIFNEYIKFFQVGTIGQFMYIEEMDQFVQDSQSMNCKDYQFLECALHYVISTWYKYDRTPVDEDTIGWIFWFRTGNRETLSLPFPGGI